jgi:hypothetical protein
MGGMDHQLVFLSTPMSFREQVPDQMIGLNRKGFVPRLAAFFLLYRVTHGNTPFWRLSSVDQVASSVRKWPLLEPILHYGQVSTKRFSIMILL